MSPPGERGARRRGRRAGTSVVETIVALLVGLLVVHVALATAARLGAAQRNLQERAGRLGSARLLSGLLRAELRYADADRDWTLRDGALEMRVFRGTGLVCPDPVAADELAVRYAGYRRPDPSKDSAFLVHASGLTEVLPLLGVGAAPTDCLGAPFDDALVLRLGRPPVALPVLVRIFERGEYSLADAALRYRRGASGRQPLTEEIWDGGSRLHLADGWLRAELRARGAPAREPVEIRSLARGATP